MSEKSKGSMVIPFKRIKTHMRLISSTHKQHMLLGRQQDTQQIHMANMANSHHKLSMLREEIHWAQKINLMVAADSHQNAEFSFCWHYLFLTFLIPYLLWVKVHLLLNLKTKGQ